MKKKVKKVIKESLYKYKKVGKPKMPPPPSPCVGHVGFWGGGGMGVPPREGAWGSFGAMP